MPKVESPAGGVRFWDEVEPEYVRTSSGTFILIEHAHKVYKAGTPSNRSANTEI